MAIKPKGAVLPFAIEIIVRRHDVEPEIVLQSPQCVDDLPVI